MDNKNFLTVSQSSPIFTRRFRLSFPYNQHLTARPISQSGDGMATVSSRKAKPLSRHVPTSAFDQYLLDIQRLPMITDPEEERRLARRAQRGDKEAAEDGPPLRGGREHSCDAQLPPELA